MWLTAFLVFPTHFVLFLCRGWMGKAIHPSLFRFFLFCFQTNWHTGTYSAFCRQYGNYSTPTSKGWHDWNGEAMKTMVQQMAEPWQGLEMWMRFQQRAIAQFIDSPTDSAADFLGKNRRDTIPTMQHHNSNDISQKMS